MRLGIRLDALFQRARLENDTMLHGSHISDPIRGNAVITLDDETMTWKSSPSDDKLEKPMSLLFTHGEAPGSGKYFVIDPDGTARAAE